MLHDCAANAVFASSAWGPSKPLSPCNRHAIAMCVVSTAVQSLLYVSLTVYVPISAENWCNCVKYSYRLTASLPE